MLSRQFSDDLADLARASERKRDAALLRATTELFAMDPVHDRDEIRRYEELATHFLSKVTTDDRRFVAERLADTADAPPAVVRLLARDIIDVAAPILQKSLALGPVDLLTVIAATGAPHHRLLAKRTSLSPEVVRALKLTGDLAVLAALDATKIEDPGPREAAIDTSARQAAISTTAARDRADPWYFLSLGRTGRLQLIAELAARPSRQHSSDASLLDRAFRSILGAAQIVGFARSGQLPAIIGAISEGLGLPRPLVAAAVHDASGELLAVMLKALRLDNVQARQVFLLASPSGHDVKQFFPLSDLFSGMEASTAEILVAAWRDSGSLRQTGHEPYLADSDRRPRPEANLTSRSSESDELDRAKRA